MALEGLYVPTTAPWFAEFKRELLSFPAGKHDDQVDALGLVGQLLDQMVPGQKPQTPEKLKKVALAIGQSLFGNGRMIGCATRNV
jgi:hypothetical protein